MNGSDEIANKAIELLREIYTNLGPQLRTQQVRGWELQLLIRQAWGVTPCNISLYSALSCVTSWEA